MTIGPIAIVGIPSASHGARIGKKQFDGAILYDHITTRTFRDVTVNGNSMKAYGVQEVLIKPDGHGYVMTRINPVDGTTMDFPDGSWATYLNYGLVTIV